MTRLASFASGKMPLLLVALATLWGASLLAAEKIDADATQVTLEEGKEYYIDEDVTKVTQLTINEGATLDLQGHSFTLTGKLVSNGKTLITNSVDNTLSTLKLDCSSMNAVGNRFSTQTKNITLGGNLKLHLSATPAGNDRQKTFQDVENTHTGGTVLEKFVSDDSRYPALVNTTNAFGTGTLTLKNGTLIRYNGSDGNLPWSGLASELGDSGASVTNEIFFTGASSGTAMSVTGAVSVAENSTLYLNLSQAQWKGHRMSGPFAGIKGTLLIACSQNNENFYLGNPDNMEDGTLALKSKAHVRMDRGGTFTYKLGALESAADVTEADDAYIYNTKNGTITLEVGALNKDTTFYGRLQKNTGDIKLDKVGTGTMRLGGVNSYEKETVISKGTLELIGSGTLGSADKAANVTFAGGTLAFGDGDEKPTTVDYSARIKDSTGAISVDTKSNEIEWETALADSNKGGLVKKGAGKLILAQVPKYSGDTVVENGLLVVKGTFDTTGAKVFVGDLAAAAEAGTGIAATAFTGAAPTLETTDTDEAEFYKLVKTTVTVGETEYPAYQVEKSTGVVIIVR